MQMARCSDKTDEQYRKISGVLKQFMRKEAYNRGIAIPQVLPPTAAGAGAQATVMASGIDRLPTGQYERSYTSL